MRLQRDSAGTGEKAKTDRAANVCLTLRRERKAGPFPGDGDVVTGDMTRRFVVVVVRERDAPLTGITRAGRVTFRTADSNYTFKLYDVMVSSSSSCEQKFKGREAGEMKRGKTVTV